VPTKEIKAGAWTRHTVNSPHLSPVLIEKIMSALSNTKGQRCQDDVAGFDRVANGVRLSSFKLTESKPILTYSTELIRFVWPAIFHVVAQD